MAIATQRPKFRTDLVAQPLEVEGQRFVDVTDPDSEQTFRFYEVEYAIAAAMDGQRDVTGLLRWANDELGLESSATELATVVNTLADLGYLEKNGVSGAGLELGDAGPGASGSDSGPAVPGGDVELGVAGGKPSGRSPAVAAGGADFELGSSGGVAKPSSPEESFAGLMDEEELGPAGGPGDVPAGAAADDRADTFGDPRAGDADEDMSLPPPPAPPAATPEPTLTRRATGGVDSTVVDDGDTQLPEPEPPAYDDDDVSVDLSDHLSLDANDVKEAVRASKVMQAVPPPDLAADIEDAAAVDEPAEEPPPIDLSTDRDDEPAPAPVGPAVEPGGSTAAPDSPRSSLGAVLGAALLVAAAAGGAYYYFVVMPQQSPTAEPPKRPGAAAPEKKPEPPAPLPPPTSVLGEGAPETADVGAVADGAIEWIIGSGEQVAEGDVVARLDGARRVEAVRRRFEKRLEHYQRKLDRATEDGDEGKIGAFQSKVDEKKALVASEDDKLAKLVMRAPTAGTVEPVVRNGATVGRGDPVVRIVGEKGLTASFARGGEGLNVGDSCSVVLGDGSKPDDCEVLEIAGAAVTIGLPPGAGSPGDKVTLEK